MTNSRGDSRRLTISTSQAVMISLGFNVGTVFVIIAREVTQSAGFDSYLVVPAAYLLTLAPILLAMAFNRFFHGLRFGQYSQKILGPIAGKIVALLFAGTAAATTSILLRRDSSLVAEALMPETPLWFFMVLQLSLAFYALSQGFEVYARVCQVLFIAVGGSLLFLFLAALPFIDFENFFPILARGVKPLAAGAMPVVAFSAQYMMLGGVLVAHMRQPQRSLRTGILGWLGAGFFLSLVVLAVQGIFSPTQVVKFLNPPLELAKVIQLGGLARGVEALLVAAWMVAGLFQGAGFYYMAAVTLNDVFAKPGYKGWLAILFVLIVGMAYPIKNPEQLFILSRYFRYYVIIPVIVGSYLLLFGVAWLRKMLRRTASDEREGQQD